MNLYDDVPARAAEYDFYAALYEAEFGDITHDLPFWTAEVGDAHSLLELGCGTGRVTRHLAPIAAKILGIDNSATMLDIARERLLDVPNVELRQADLTAIPAESGTFDLVVMPLGAAVYLVDPRDQYRFAAELYRVMAPNGRFVLDFPLYGPQDALLTGAGDVFLNRTLCFEDGTSAVYWASSAFNKKWSVIELSIVVETFDEDDQSVGRRRLRYNVKAYTLSELLSLFQSVGLTVDMFYGDYARSTVDASSSRLIACGSKVHCD